MLVKKTIVLYGKGGQGHLTAVRVGGSTGFKLVLDAPVTKLALALKIGNSEQMNFVVTSSKTELPLKISLESHDELSAVVYSEDGSELLSGGKKTRFEFPKQIFGGRETRAETASGTVTPVSSDDPEAAETTIGEPDKTARSGNGDTFSETAAKDPEVSSDADAAGKISDDAAETDPEKTSETASGTETVTDTDTAETATETAKSASETSNSETDTDPGEDGKADLRAAFSGFAFNKGENFYINIRGKLEEIMTINPECKELEKLIPDSKWVKVYYDEDEYYVVGILTEEGAVKYLGYGVPGVEGIRPPKEAEELCDFLPSGGEEEGYWIMLQKADNGELIK